MVKRRIAYVVSNVHKAFAFEWIAAGFKDKYELTFILLNKGPSALEDFLKMNNVPIKRIRYRGKLDFLKALIQTWRILIAIRAQVVHCHLIDAQLIGLTAAWLARLRMRIYTRHNSTYHHVYHPRGVKFDRWSNWLATHIISVSQATDKTLIDMENVRKEKIIRIEHGFHWNEFVDVSNERVLQVRTRWSIPQANPVIGSIARHIEWKGVQYIVQAFAAFLKSYPNAFLVLANASGPYHKIICDMLDEQVRPNVILIPFEEDVAALYRTFDLFVHVPVDELSEAFGQTYVEALAAGIPSVFTRSGIAAEFAEDQRNAALVPFRDALAINQALIALWSSEELRHRLTVNGKHDVFLRFGLDRMMSSLEKVYDTAPVL